MKLSTSIATLALGFAATASANSMHQAPPPHVPQRPAIIISLDAYLRRDQELDNEEYGLQPAGTLENSAQPRYGKQRAFTNYEP